MIAALLCGTMAHLPTTPSAGKPFYSGGWISRITLLGIPGDGMGKSGASSLHLGQKLAQIIGSWTTALENASYYLVGSPRVQRRGESLHPPPRGGAGEGEGRAQDT